MNELKSFTLNGNTYDSFVDKQARGMFTQEVVQNLIDNALAQAKASGEFDGVSVTHRWVGTTLFITSASGTSSADLKGPTGNAGESDFFAVTLNLDTSKASHSKSEIMNAVNAGMGVFGVYNGTVLPYYRNGSSGVEFQTIIRVPGGENVTLGVLTAIVDENKKITINQEILPSASASEPALIDLVALGIADVSVQGTTISVPADQMQQIVAKLEAGVVLRVTFASSMIGGAAIATASTTLCVPQSGMWAAVFMAGTILLAVQVMPAQNAIMAQLLPLNIDE